jgi:cytochrome bd-type quinol oxidase subunit 2
MLLQIKHRHDEGVLLFYKSASSPYTLPVVSWIALTFIPFVIA